MRDVDVEAAELEVFVAAGPQRHLVGQVPTSGSTVEFVVRSHVDIDRGGVSLARNNVGKHFKDYH